MRTITELRQRLADAKAALNAFEADTAQHLLRPAMP